MTLGARIKRLRLERNWSQTQFAQHLKVHQKQISGYERDVHVPSTELLIRMAALFNVSLDYLAFENREDLQQVQIADRDLLQKLEAIDQLTDADRTTVKAVLDTFILKNRFQQLASSHEEQPA
ncbi:MAG: helix-turn-helix domain-containing protein [Gammaproteobacteria bacterium]